MIPDLMAMHCLMQWPFEWILLYALADLHRYVVKRFAVYWT